MSFVFRLLYDCLIVTADYLVVGSDSGRIVILEYNLQKNVFEKVFLYFFV